MLTSTHFAVALLAASTTITATPITTLTHPLAARDYNPDISGCSESQKKHLEKSVKQVNQLAVTAYSRLSDGETWKTDNGYKHYFKEDAHAKVKEGFRVLMGISDTPRFNLQCVTNEDANCKSGSFAYTDPTEEDFDKFGHKKGVRTISVCPDFFTSRRTTGDLPDFNDKPGLEKYCEGKELKKIMGFEVGGHTLLHEITHLDSFGKLAGYSEETHKRKGDEDTDNDFEYTYHGTVDWRNKGDAGNARVLKGSKAKNRPETWQNAESLAASATEIGAELRCDLKDIPT